MVNTVVGKIHTIITAGSPNDNVANTYIVKRARDVSTSRLKSEYMCMGEASPCARCGLCAYGREYARRMKEQAT